MIRPEHETTHQIPQCPSHTRAVKQPKNKHAGRASALCVAPKKTQNREDRRQEAMFGIVKAANIQLLTFPGLLRFLRDFQRRRGIVKY